MADRTVTALGIFGPVMIGPSSSHTAGVARIAFLAKGVFPYAIERARVSFYGSLARTYRGHGSDKAAVAGLMGIRPDDERLGFAMDLAKRDDLPYEIVPVMDGPERYHPNTAVVELWGEGQYLRVRGASIGGGKIVLQSINGFDAELNGELDAILVVHRDRPGVIAIVSHILAANGINIASAVSHRKDKGDEALLVVEVDGHVPSAIVRQMEGLPPVLGIVYVPALEV